MLRTLSIGLIRNVAQSGNATRCMSSAAGKLVNLEVNDKTGIATLTLNRPPVNSLNLELLSDISSALDQVAGNRSKGLILTSSSNKVFSAGLDIMEMYKPQQDRARQFWSTLQDVWLKLYGTAYPTAAAINGHSPAGGCLLAMCCEYRAMCPNFTIGLNETQLGIIAPTWFKDTMLNVLPRRVTENALTLGKLFTTDEALKVGLIDDVATDKADALAKSEQFIRSFDKVSTSARGLTKQMIRNDDLQKLRDNKKQDVEVFLMVINQPKVQQQLEMYIQSLKKK